jgi:hypothetical protein
MKVSKALFSVAVLALASPALAAPTSSWNGTWAGTTKTGDTVSVTIAGGRVVAYSLRGAEPFPIQYSHLTARSAAFGDHENYSVRIIKIGGRMAYGTAHSPIGDGSAPLFKQ